MIKSQLYTSIAVVAGLAVVALFFVSNGSFFTQPPELLSGVATTTNQSTGLVVQDEEVGTGVAAQAGDYVTVNYTGKLQNGTVFDTSIGREPFPFVLGVGKVIPGWDQGLQGMKVGGKRLLIVPSGLAYGHQGFGSIPPDATLIFEVDLLKVEQAPSSASAVNLEGANAD